MKEYEKPLKAFANKRRLAIVKFFKKKKEANVSEIAESIKLSFKSTSRHLAVLLNADILEKEQRNISCFYSLAPKLSLVAKSIVSLL